jgi:hypothetical protein
MPRPRAALLERRLGQAYDRVAGCAPLRLRAGPARPASRRFRLLGRFAILAALLSAGLAIAAPAHAQLLGLERFLAPPKVGYMAAVTVSSDGQRADGRIYRAPDKERREFEVEGESKIVIVRMDLKRVWSLVPEEKIFIESSFDDALGKPARKGEQGKPEITLTPLGRDRMAGLPAVKQRITGVDVDGRPIDGTVWFSEEGIVLCVESLVTDDEGGKHKVRMELHDVKIGPQDAKLFEIPPDYRAAGQTRTGEASRPSGAERG